MNPSASSLHSRREALGFGASGLGLAVAGSVLNAVRAQAATDEPGAPRSAGPLQSAGAMTFGPGTVLFVGDIAGSAVHAFALRDEDLTPQTGVELGNFHNFEGVDLVRGAGGRPSSHLTHRWREPDSNHRSRSCEGSSGRCQSEAAARRWTHLQVQVRDGDACLEWHP
jgi:hypothetical protein